MLYNYTIGQLVVSVVDYKWQFILREAREFIDCREMMMSLSIDRYQWSVRSIVSSKGKENKGLTKRAVGEW